jgi:hypothetical protein
MVDSRRRWSFSLAQDSREARHALRQHCRAARLDTRRHQDTQHQDGDWVEQSGELTPYEYGLLSVSTRNIIARGYRQEVYLRIFQEVYTSSISVLMMYTYDVRAPKPEGREATDVRELTKLSFLHLGVKLGERKSN